MTEVAIPTTELYFEAHITIKPLGEDTLLRARVKSAGEIMGFRLATFLLKKDDQPLPDDFFSARSTDYEEIKSKVDTMVWWLQEYGVTVKRYKIENTLLDVRL